MVYKTLGVRLFGNIVDKYGGSFIYLRDSLISANMKTSYRTYMSVAFLFTLITFFGSIVALFVLIGIGVINVPPVMQVIYFVFVPFLSAIVAFGVMLAYPSQIIYNRKRNIETNLPFVLTHMGAVAESGVPPQIIFKLISEFEEYGDISIEMKKIVRNVDEFGVDPLTALKQIADRTPSISLKQVLLGFVTTVESGGDIKIYLKSSGQQSLFEWRIKREKFLQQLSAYAEFYTGLLIAAPLFIISLFAVMNMIQPDIAGYNILDLTKLSIYLLVPALNTGFLLFLRGVEVEI